jgi:hypothetical protein
MHLLPLSLGRLADHTHALGTLRYSLEAIYLQLGPGNTFEAVATDSKVLVRVTGPCVADPAAFPEIPEFAAKPDGGTSALIPADAWRRAFNLGQKLAKKPRIGNPATRSVAVRIGESETTLAVANEDYQWCESTPTLTGQFPPYREFIAGCGGHIRDRLWIDPRLLGAFLRTAAECVVEAKAPGVWIETSGPTRPLLARFVRPDGLEFIGLLMPLVPDDPSPPPSGIPDRYATLERRCESLQSERDELARQVAELKAELVDARKPRLPGME